MGRALLKAGVAAARREAKMGWGWVSTRLGCGKLVPG